MKGAASARPRRAFEPELDWSDAPREPRAQDFADRELARLCEQGNFERARIRLAKQVAAGALEPGPYLDAIRVERCANPAGEAWQAWLTRALSAGVAVAGALPRLLPVSALRAYACRLQIGWATLERQTDPAAARELLCLRLEQQALDAPGEALPELEDPALRRGAQQHPALQRVAVAVMAAAVWRHPARVLMLAPHYGVELGAVEPSPDGVRDADPHALLLQAHELQAAWHQAGAEQPVPPAFERALRAAWLVRRARARALHAELCADLRARRHDYLGCADAVLRASPQLASWLQGSLDRAFDEACGEKRPPPPLRLDDAARALRADPLRRAWLASFALLPLAASLAARAGGRAAWLLLLPAALAPWLCGRALDALAYRRILRPALLFALSAQGVAHEALLAALRAAALPRRRQLARRCAADRALGLLGALAALRADDPEP